MHLLGSLDDLSVEELIEQTNDEDKYLVETFLKKMENLVDRYISIRREELRSPELKYRLEKVVLNNSKTLTAVYSYTECNCSSSCEFGYERTEYEIKLGNLLISKEEIRKIFSAEKAETEKMFTPVMKKAQV